MKYLILEDETLLPRVVIFDELTDHIEMKNRMPTDWKLISAGRISFCALGEDGNMEVGRAIPGSVTLGIKYTQLRMVEDHDIVRKTLQFQG